MTEGQKAFKVALVNAMGGLCPRGRTKNKQGNHCCRMCRDGYGTHSALCRHSNEGRK